MTIRFGALIWLRMRVSIVDEYFSPALIKYLKVKLMWFMAMVRAETKL